MALTGRWTICTVHIVRLDLNRYIVIRCNSDARVLPGASTFTLGQEFLLPGVFLGGVSAVRSGAQATVDAGERSHIATVALQGV